MIYGALEDFLQTGKPILAKGPVALIFAEDEVEIGTTLRHHLNCGFTSVVALMPDAFDVPSDVEDLIHRVPYDCTSAEAVITAVNRIIAAATPGCWLYYCYNGEYLFYPFCETRTVREMLAFHTEERRDAMLTYVIWTRTQVRFRSRMPVWTNPAITPKGAVIPRQAIQGTASWISLAVSAGGMRSTFPKPAAKSTGLRCFVSKRGCSFRTITRSTIRNTTPMPAHGITT